jgi:competence protein ComEC
MLGGTGEGAAIGLLARLRSQLDSEQERWFGWLPVLLGCGIGAYFALPAEPTLLLAAMPLLAALAVHAAGAGRGTLGRVFVAGLLATTFGFALAKLRVETVAAPVLAHQMNAVEVRGWVELIEPRTTRGKRLTLRTITVGKLAATQQPARVRVSVPRIPPDLQPGTAVRLKASLMPPSAPALPGDYDFARQAYFHGIGAVGYSLSTPAIDEAAPDAPLDLRFWAAIERVRQAMGARVIAALPGETGGIANALITGERGGITEATTNAYRDSGILHILSISGFHMAIVAGSVFFVLRFMLATFPAIALRYPIKKWAAALAMAAAFAYLLTSGGAFATVRSAIMISIMFLAVLLDRPALALRNVVLAATIILVLFPESLFDVGFQMSFAAVLALVCAYEALRRSETWGALMESPTARTALFFGGIVLSTLIASAAVAPFGAYHFHKSQQYSVLANLIALPACNLLVMPAALAALVLMPFGLEYYPLWIMGFGIDAMTWTAFRVAGLPGSVLHIAAMPQSAFLLMVAGGLWLLLWQTRWRMLGLVAIAAGVALAPTLTAPDLIIGHDAELIALRGRDGEFSALGAGRQSFELERWLEHDGSARDLAEAAKATAFACDGVGCNATVKGLMVAVARHPAAFAEDCRRAMIVISPIVSPLGCTSPKAVIDFFAARRKGTHAVYIGTDGSIRIDTVAGARGNRPWSTPPAQPHASDDGEAKHASVLDAAPAQ